MRRHNILIVDDEVLVRTNIKLMLSDAADCIQICGEAANGREALEKLKVLEIDVVLSDIKMPEMDGLTLCRELRRTHPEITFIGLSNYDDYEYVRGTMTNGGVDYLLKHAMTPDMLIDTILRVPLKTQETSKYRINENSLNALRKNYIASLLGGMFSSEEEVLHTCRLLDIPLDFKNTLPIVLSIDNYAGVLGSQPLQKQSIIEFSLVNIGNEILQGCMRGILTHVSDEYYCILLSMEDISSTAKQNELLQTLLKQLSYNLQTYLNLSTSYSIGTLCHDVRSVAASYARAQEALKYTFYSGNSSILHFTELPNVKSCLNGLDSQMEQTLLSLTTQGNQAALLDVLALVFSQIRSEHLSLQSAQMFFTDLLSILMRTAKKNSISLDSVFRNLAAPNEMLSGQHTLDQIEDWFAKGFSSLFLHMKPAASIDSEYIRQAVNILNRDYALPLSQQQVADEIGISSGYLSTIFKEETGQGFHDYLTALRIKMATHMLTETATDFRAIASACGFQDYSYFFKVFKKRMGCTPTQYRQRAFQTAP